MGGAWGTYGGKFCRTQLIGRARHKWRDITKRDLKEI
jgi:hypothetical protein